jgi:uncharacterized protein with FMN-binding domain
MPAKNTLLALGSAAVIAVYGAGFERTRAAAQRFAGDDAERRPARPAPAIGDAHVQAAPVARRPARKPAGSVVRRHNAAPVEPGAPAIPTPAIPAPAIPTPTAPSATPPSAPVPVPVATVIDTTVADTSQTDDEQRGMYRDGTYSGWGTSRHGDIQAAVEIKGGRIVSAYITQCLTRYSCSWISALPPQVAARQSADVDFVSGATQSSNAFYSAVLEALNRAR